MPHLRKSDVQTRNGHPSVQVKGLMWPHPQRIADRLNVDEATAENASRLAYESACESFWEEWRNVDRYPQPDDRPYFDRPVYVYQDGRQGGWLYVTGLPPIETWDAVVLAKWARFQRDVEADVAYRCSLDNIVETIVANQWTEPGAELYNLIDTPDGPRSLYQHALAHV